MDNVIPLFPNKDKNLPSFLKPVLNDHHPEIVSIIMINAALSEAYKYGYKLKDNPEVMLDFEYILKLVCASISRDYGIDHPFQPVLDKLSGANQDQDS